MLRNDVKEEGKAKIAQLVREFRNFAASQDESEANEERVKIGFIAPLLEALRWNMRTDEVLPEQRTLGERQTSVFVPTAPRLKYT